MESLTVNKKAEIFTQVLKTCLDQFEEQETQMLSWGDTESFFKHDEVMSVIYRVVRQYEEQKWYFDANSIFEALTQEHAMLIEIPMADNVNNSSGCYRTRMAESVNLFKLQRQLFWSKKLEDSKTLVSDFRFLRRPRSYPIRNLKPAEIKQKYKSSELAHFVPILEHILNDQFKLSGFQARSLSRILNEYQRQQTRNTNSQNFYKQSITGTIVCAGTGSGKTMSFYLPGLTALVDHLTQNPQLSVRILAIYPRQELLKDQFYETWKQCRNLDEYAQQKIGRKIRIGSFFGITPKSIEKEYAKHKNKKTHMLFDLLHCSTEKCGGRIHWNFSDLECGIERLSCSICNAEIPADEVLLSREVQKYTPPDILFTTTEMLNRQMSNPNFQHLFGIGDKVQKPIMVLMDEVHTYEGTTGAQTAYLLRRWQKMSQAKPHFVGLSATLNDANNFFANLIGASSNQVVLMEPSHEEMLEEGAEYTLLLRGDPVSETALLSTTIQTSILTRRILDNKSKKSAGTWGNKTFIFTDDLDVNNRLYHALINAEGWRLRGKSLEPHPEDKPLAAIRGSYKIADERIKKQIIFGQNWSIASQIGHSLDKNDRAKLCRTSSQDNGVDSQAEIIVATASLEVGFNDPEVGAVIQHKAPKGVASFLQRKGRAGRSREMRPWLIVVLSEFGRDRAVFQRYETLMSPQVKSRGLPLNNRHIQKMQAAMVLLDWLGQGLDKSIWTILTYPYYIPQNSIDKTPHPVKNLRKIETKIERLLDNPNEFKKFRDFLKYALQVDEQTVQALLWESPRSLMLTIIPTLLRNLKTHWRVNNVEWAGVRYGSSPLPEFIPENLFSDLNVPDVHVLLQRGQYIKNENLGFYQGMREFAPGRLSKRYAIEKNVCDWLIPGYFNPKNSPDGDYQFEITEAFGEDLHDEGILQIENNHTLQLFRPKEIYTRKLEFNFRLKDKSNAMIQWLAQFYDYSEIIEQPPKGSWSKHLKEIKFCLHKYASPVEVVRYSHTTKADLSFQNNEKRKINFIWQKNGIKTAIGARQWVDGVCLSFKLDLQDIQSILMDVEIQKSIRILLFKDRLNKCISFDNNSFTANWVYECYMAALAQYLPQTDLSQEESIIHQAVNGLARPDGQRYLQRVPFSLFHSDVNNEDPEQKLQTDLLEIFQSPKVINELTQCATVLWQDIDKIEEVIDFTYDITKNTLAAICYQSLFSLLNDADERAVLVDIEQKDQQINIWLTEAEQGGCGIIANFVELYQADPRRVLNIFMKHLRAGEYEQINDELHQLLIEIQNSSDLQTLLTQVRNANDHKQRRDANTKLQYSLQQRGYILNQSFLNLLYSRILRPGSTSKSDLDMLKLLERWQHLEQQTGLEWALNLFTHTVANQDVLSQRVEEIFDKHCNYQSILWPRGQIIRDSELNYYNQFKPIHITERLLVKKLFTEKIDRIICEDFSFAKLHQALIAQGVVDLVIKKKGQYSVAQIMLKLQEQHVDYYGLWLYPRIVALYQEIGIVVLRVEIAEAVQ